MAESFEPEDYTSAQVFLMMRVGHLCEMSRDDRRKLLDEFSLGENLESLLDESFLPVEDWAQFPDDDIKALQKEMRWVGRDLGVELVQGNDLRYTPATDYQLMEPAISSVFSKRMSHIETKRNFSFWHTVNTLYFFSICISLVSVELDEEWAAILFAIWMISGFRAVSTSAKEGRRIAQIWHEEYSRLEYVLQEPVEQGIEEVFAEERDRLRDIKPPSRYWEPHNEE